ncbi:hypothetical protein F5883DRAFT_652783 [Diaporthe sp. PMI_573]|nr:hypothetical protein F5883DRAFT_652783 [Diaporthaceae sp. PMI_573]
MKLNDYTLLILHAAVAFFSAATLAFEVYTACQSLGWLHDFAHLYYYGSSEWNWIVAILVLSILSPLANVCSVVWNTRRMFKVSSYFDEKVIQIFIIIWSLFELGVKLPHWIALQTHGWPDDLREVGHPDHAAAMDTVQRYLMAIVIFYAAVAGICVLNLVSPHFFQCCKELLFDWLESCSRRVSREKQGELQSRATAPAADEGV